MDDEMNEPLCGCGTLGDHMKKAEVLVDKLIELADGCDASATFLGEVAMMATRSALLKRVGKGNIPTAIGLISARLIVADVHNRVESAAEEVDRLGSRVNVGNELNRQESKVDGKYDVRDHLRKGD